MIEVLQESIRLVNLPYTLFFGVCVLYWVLYLVGVFGSDLLDFDFGGHGDAGGDVGGDLGGDVGGDLHGGGHDGGHVHGEFGLGALMRFVYAADVPVTIIVTVFSMAMWCLSIITNYYSGNASLLLAALFVIPIAGVGLLATKVVLMPFVPVLKKAFDESSDVILVIGQLCVVTSLEATPRHGQAEVPLTGAPLMLNVRTRSGVTLRKGDEAVVVAKDDDGVYIVAPFDAAPNKESEHEV